MKSYDHVISLLVDEPWAILPEKFAAICEFINLKLSGVDMPRYEAAERREERRAQNVAVLPLFGVIGHRTNMITSFSGGTSLDKFGRELMALVDDPEIGAIVLDVDSPGGSVAGLEETAIVIDRASKHKPIIAHANSCAASAAYFLASQATEFWVTPSGQVGSIGVIAAHQDNSGALEKLGIKTTIISAGKYKAEGNSTEPLSEAARDYMQERVDEYYDTFIKAVAHGRRVSEKEVRSGFGQGRMVTAREALELGMVDRVGTLDDILAHIGKGDFGKAKQRAEAPDLAIAAADESRLFWAKERYQG